ncbi:DUF7577 domain-containing protein [Haloglomus litoreum]|uniref:DUF7577 domain-containing protein n=1 Tax=Haloglomus litoreum TaxID=3034026 RepID=UPI0023E88B77|nr:hypothetical protein [Haloglomus sp. DT116]
MYDPQVYGLLGAVLLLHLGTLVYVYLRRQRSGESPTLESGAAVDRSATDGSRADTGVDVETAESAETVICSACGVRNAADYRFCRACVADLSGGASHDSGEAFSNAA